MIKSKLLILTTSLLMLSACNSVSDQTANFETVNNDNEIDNIISEQFIITSVENGIIRGELVNGSGEGIYYNLNELDSNEYDLFSKLDLNDLVRIEWTKENYDNNEWLDMNRVSYNKQGNVNNVNVSMKEGK